jgi:hypothetical protein
MLSPIPWIKKDSTPEPEPIALDDDGRDTSLASDDAQPLPTSEHPHASADHHSPGADLPSGRVDELDPGPEAREAGQVDSDPGMRFRSQPKGSAHAGQLQ